MDPLSLAGLVLQTAQFALRSGLALRQFAKDAHHVKANVNELAFEVTALGNACKIVHDQLRGLAKSYERTSIGQDDGIPLWKSVEEQLVSCNTTLHVLRRALGGVNLDSSNFVTQSWQQFKLNLKQPEIIAMKSRIQSHTSALQVSLLVMDIKVSHLAPRRVDKSLAAKLENLQKLMKNLERSLEMQSQKLNQLIDFNDDCATPQRKSQTKALLSRRNIRAITASRDLCISPLHDKLLDHECPMKQHGAQHGAKGKVVNDLVLQCAQVTLSRGTSLYEESMYEGSVSDSGAPCDGVPGLTYHNSSLRSVHKAQSSPNGLRDEVLEPPERFHLCASDIEPSTSQSNLLNVAPSLHQRKVEQTRLSDPNHTREVDCPLNLPPHLQRSFQVLQGSLQSQTTLGQIGLGPHRKLFPTSSPNNRRASIAREPKINTRVVIAETPELEGDSPPDLRPTTMNAVSKEALTLLSNNPNYTTAPRQVDGTSIRYIEHINGDIREASFAEVLASRQHILEKISPSTSVLLLTNRVALTGRLGIGKTYLAMACVYRLMQQYPSVPIFWVRADQLDVDCKAITAMLGLKTPPSTTKPWDWLCKIVRRLSNNIIGPWLLVIDGANVEISDEPGMQKLSETKEGPHGYILMTTRHLDTANTFVNGGIRIDVDALDPVDAANVLGDSTETPLSPVFDEIAHSLGFDPSITRQVRTFLDMTGMPPVDFTIQLNSLLNEENWSKDGMATTAAGLLSRKQCPEWPAAPMLQSHDISALLPVFRSCINPSWLFLFDKLDEKHSAAAELLAVLSVLGRVSVPKSLLSANATVKSATMVLLDQSILQERTEDMHGARLTFLAHRVWLAERDGLASAYKAALKMIACAYPDARIPTNREQCTAFQPLASAAMSSTADSWTQDDRGCALLRAMLVEKMSEYENS